MKFDAAEMHYETARTDLGIEFIAEIDRCSEMVADQPEIGAKISKDARRISAKRFPYRGKIGAYRGTSQFF